MSKDAPLKVNSTAAAGDFLLDMKCFFHKIKDIMRYTLHICGQHTSTVGHIVRSENIGSTWRCLEHMWGRL
jgi:hypothetical protein